MTGPTYRALGHTFRIACDAMPLERYLRRIMAPLAAADGEGAETTYRLAVASGPPYVLEADAGVVISSDDPTRPVAHLLNRVNTTAIETTASSHTLLHAGVVAIEGRAVLLPAPMEAGKSTLVAGLVRAGATYITDEVGALVPRSRQLVAYPRSLSLDPGSWPMFRHWAPQERQEVRAYLPEQWQIPLCGAASAATAQEFDVGLVVHHRYQRGAATCQRNLSALDGLKRLLESCFSLTAHPDRDLDALATLAESVPQMGLVSGDLDEACKAVLSAVTAFVPRTRDTGPAQ